MNQKNNALIKDDIDNNTSDISQEDQDKYQQILDEYSQQLKSKTDQDNTDQGKLSPQDPLTPPPPEDHKAYVNPPPVPPVSPPPPVLEPIKTVKVSPPKQTLTSPPSLPDIPKDKEDKIDKEDQANSLPPPKPSKKKFDFFKYLFYISVIVFFTLVILLVKDYLTLQSVDKSSSSTLLPTISPTITKQETQKNTGCVLNEVNYQIGETVPSQDKCNICICQQTELGLEVVCSLAEDCQN